MWRICYKNINRWRVWSCVIEKLLEETNEVISSKSSGETLEELADVLEILMSIASKLNGKTLDDVLKIAAQKKLKRGGFEKRIFLEKTYKK